MKRYQQLVINFEPGSVDSTIDNLGLRVNNSMEAWRHGSMGGVEPETLEPWNLGTIEQSNN